ncbi:hypothetical protein HCC18_08865 [Listeria booriae]|uniref:Uncharacterized protein n=1 Tax=Listeria booriae TaxID=1552123 RepID=A0A7X1CZL1_9LIST|nr:hypothetical protein [Listeria booriae]MBC2022718.1 hypothetical protein [Listeria booriae]MBC2105478.1 hypothetical protein [Listeria booriae]MBC2117489.1 hypothetical protein [Listeria booriae]MBC2316958.1 hypothetical protein [Listeria booriae]
MLVYYGPDGEFINNPSNEFLKEILNKDSVYWNQGGGDSLLFIEEETYRLIFFKDEEHGFFIMRHPDYVAPFNPDIEVYTVHHDIGGEPMATPSSSYVGLADAEKIILEFATKGSNENVQEWKDIYEIIDFDS